MPTPKAVPVTFSATEYRILEDSAKALGHDVPWLVHDVVREYCTVMASQITGQGDPLGDLLTARGNLDKAIAAAEGLPAARQSLRH